MSLLENPAIKKRTLLLSTWFRKCSMDAIAKLEPGSDVGCVIAYIDGLFMAEPLYLMAQMVVPANREDVFCNYTYDPMIQERIDAIGNPALSEALRTKLRRDCHTKVLDRDLMLQYINAIAVANRRLFAARYLNLGGDND